MRAAPSPYRHFERSREIFLAYWSDKRCGRAVNTVLHTTWNDGLPHMYCCPAGKKDPSAALGMTKREDGLSYIPLHPTAGANLRPFGAPPSRGRRKSFPPWGRRRNENTAASHPKPSPRGEGAPKGRIGHWRYESEREKRFKQAENESSAFPVSSFRAKREIFLAHR